jgi:hypothetical protein
MNIEGRNFLIDSCALITPYRGYYSFDFAKGFWNQMETCIKSGTILILSKVREEVISCEDPLSDWMKEFDKGLFISHKTPEIIGIYGKVLEYIKNEPCYKNPNALAIWAKESVADAWLIAASKVTGYPIVTTEVGKDLINPKCPSKNPKIPNVAEHFGVEVISLFAMMKELSFTL